MSVRSTHAPRPCAHALWRSVCLAWALLAASPVAAAPSDVVDISSGGTPQLQGALGNSGVIANPDNLADLEVTVDFGELSPLNRSGMVLVRIPVIIRSTTAYELRASLSGASFATDPMGLRPSDVGFGIQNLRPMSGAKLCRNHQLFAPFDSDPSAITVGATRVSFPSSLANVGSSTLLMRGPLLSKGAVKPRKADNGWLFDVVLAVVPQFFAASTSSVTVTLSITRADFPDCI